MNITNKIISVLFFLNIFQVKLFSAAWQVYNHGTGLPSDRVLNVRSYPRQLLACTDKGLGLLHGDSPVWLIINKDSGLPENMVFDALFDSGANLWVATAAGLAVSGAPYEKWFIHQTREGLPDINVRTLAFDGHFIYAGCVGGKVAFAPAGSAGRVVFRTISSDVYLSKNRDSFANPVVSKIAIEGEIKGYYSTHGAGLYRFSGGRAAPLIPLHAKPVKWLEYVSVFPYFPISLSKFELTKKARILFCGSDGYQIFLSDKSQKIIPFPGENLTSGYESRKKWLSFIELEFHPGNDDSLLLADENYQVGEEDLKKFDRVVFNRAIWFGTKDQGVFRYQKKKWNHYLPQNSNLPSKSVNAIHFDAEHTYLATDKGLVQISKTSEQFKALEKLGWGKNFMTILPSIGVEQEIRKIFLEKRMLLASDKGLHVLDDDRGLDNYVLIDEDLRGQDDRNTDAKPDGHFFFFEKNGKLPSNDLLDIAKDEFSYYWIATKDEGLVRFRIEDIILEDGKKRRKFYFKTFGSHYVGTSYLACLYYKAPYLWIGTKDAGLVRMEMTRSTNSREQDDFEGIEYSFDRFSLIEGLADKEVIGIFPFEHPAKDQDYPLILHPKSMSMHSSERWGEIKLLAGAMGTRYNTFYQDTSSCSWIGTGNGLYRVFPDGRQVSYNTAYVPTFFDNNVVKIVPSSTTGPAGETIFVAVRNSQNQDQFNIKRDPLTGEKKVYESDIDGGGLLWFDGKVWDNYKIPGILDLKFSDDYLFIGTDKRLRRILFSQ
ncbi:hypothetical protein ACFL35_18335 [Candidatus Riflebacteria bacterium]